MDSESIGDVKKALEGFPGLAGVAVVEHGKGQAEECLISCVVPPPRRDPGHGGGNGQCRRPGRMAGTRK